MLYKYTVTVLLTIWCDVENPAVLWLGVVNIHGKNPIYFLPKIPSFFMGFLGGWSKGLYNIFRYILHFFQLDGWWAISGRTRPGFSPLEMFDPKTPQPFGPKTLPRKATCGHAKR